MKIRLFVLCLGIICLIGLASTSADAGPCRGNGWQPTFVHDLITPDGPYYVMPNGSFVKLVGMSQREWTNHACRLISTNGVRNRRGYTTCNDYTRIQCGCDAGSRSNNTCANFLRFKRH
ncbi:MAG: hypothetical protein PHC90_03700 [Syntrophorhabdaceae bacterium]|nr:hypothetical protein [Syntrophorhabdaceae bacterium]